MARIEWLELWWKEGNKVSRCWCLLEGSGCAPIGKDIKALISEVQAVISDVAAPVVQHNLLEGDFVLMGKLPEVF